MFPPLENNLKTRDWLQAYEAMLNKKKDLSPSKIAKITKSDRRTIGKIHRVAKERASYLRQIINRERGDFRKPYGDTRGVLCKQDD